MTFLKMIDEICLSFMPTVRDCRYMASQFVSSFISSYSRHHFFFFCGRSTSPCLQLYSTLEPPHVSGCWVSSSHRLRFGSLMVCRSSRSSLGCPAGARSVPRNRPDQLVASHHRCRRNLQRRPCHWLHNIRWQEKGHCLSWLQLRHQVLMRLNMSTGLFFLYWS